MAAVGRKSHDAFEQPSGLVVGQREIAVAALLALREQSAGLQLGQMGARRLQRDARRTGRLVLGDRVVAGQPLHLYVPK